MQTLTHSQAHAAGDLASVGATAGRIARINESRAFAASEKALFNDGLQAIRTVTMTPDRVQQLLATLYARMESDGRYSEGNGWHGMQQAVITCFGVIDSEVNSEEGPTLEDMASLAGRVA